MEDKSRSGLAIGVVIAVAVAIGLTIAVIAGLLPGGPSPPAGQSSPQIVSPSGSPTPSPTSPVGCDDAIHEPGALTLRIESFTDLGRHWVISIYGDGRVLTPGITPNEYSDEAWMLIRRLTDAGVETLVSEAVDSGLFEASAQYPPVPLPGVEAPGRGASGYAITAARGDELVVVSWTSMFSDDALYYEPSPEREQLDALAVHLVDFDSWLPAEGWAMAEPCLYHAQAFRIFVEAQAWGGSLDDLPVDIADIDWPLGGEVLDWGEELDTARADPGYMARCGVASRADAEMVADDLRSAGAEGFLDEGVDVTSYTELRLGDRAATRVVSVYLEPLMPDESGCTDYVPNAFGI